MATKAGTDHPLERLVFFSDAVFAIAITLLIIEVHPPHIARWSPDHDHLVELVKLIPNFIGYMISFAVIGAFWAGHHRAFMLAAHYSPKIIFWNLLFLFSVAFLPFVTAYVSAYSGERVPTMLYCVWLMLAGMLNYKVNSMASSPPMVGEDVPLEERRYIRRRGLSVILGAATAIVIAAIYPQSGQAGLATIPLWRHLLARLQRS
jgi:uncharacterized membrane protein